MWLRYVLSSLAVLLVPLVIVNAVAFRQLLTAAQERVSASLVADLRSLSRDVDSDLEELRRIALEMTVNPRLTPFQFADGPLSRLRIVEELQRYASSSPLAWQIGLLPRGETQLLSNEGSFDLERFFTVHFRPHGVDVSSLLADLYEGAATRAYPPVTIERGPQDVRRSLIATYPLPLGAGSPYATVVFIADLGRVSNMVLRTHVGQTGNAVVLDSGGSLVASRLPVDIAHLDELVTDARARPGRFSSDRVTVAGEQFVAASASSPATGWVSIAMMPVAELRREISAARRTALLSNIAIVAIGSGLAFLLASFAYRPIGGLVAAVRTASGTSVDHWDEVASLTEVYRDLSAANTRMRDEIARSAQALREHLLLGALKGQIRSLRAFNDRGHDVGVRLEGPNLCVSVIVLRASGEEDHRSPHGLMRVVEAGFPAGVVGFAKETVAGDHVPLVVGFLEMEDEALVKAHHAVVSHVSRELGFECSIGIGSRTQSMQDLPESYLQALAAADQAEAAERPEVCLYRRDENLRVRHGEYPQEQIDALVEAVRRGDVRRSGASAAALRTALSQSAFAPSDVRLVAFDVIAHLLRTIREAASSHPQLLDLIPDTLLTSRQSSTAQLMATIRGFSERIATELDAVKESHNTALVEQVIDHIRESYAKYDFSVATMAAELDVSSSYLSRFFRNQTGVTISEYVTRVRMERARSLLSQTTKSVHEIGLEVGYYDTSNFIRRFKVVEGRTPGEYRLLYGANGSVRRRHRNESPPTAPLPSANPPVVPQQAHRRNRT